MPQNNSNNGNYNNVENRVLLVNIIVDMLGSAKKYNKEFSSLKAAILSTSTKETLSLVLTKRNAASGEENGEI